MKERLDTLLVRKGFFESREKAKRNIMAGLVYVDNQISDKAGTKVNIDSEIKVKGKECPYVGRGGYKLEKALKSFNINLNNKICGDIGASTGGFTDCMLQNGSKKVYSMDVGYGQLDWKLRNDSRVINMEKCNVRYLLPEDIDDKLDFISIDVSFISLKLILPVAYNIMSDEGELVCLIKPQFEAGREQVGKNGIVKDLKIHREVIINVMNYAKISGFNIYDLDFSPITGAKGNIEYLLYVGKTPKLEYNLSSVDQVVERSHKQLE